MSNTYTTTADVTITGTEQNLITYPLDAEASFMELLGESNEEFETTRVLYPICLTIPTNTSDTLQTAINTSNTLCAYTSNTSLNNIVPKQIQSSTTVTKPLPSHIVEVFNSPHYKKNIETINLLVNGESHTLIGKKAIYMLVKAIHEVSSNNKNIAALINRRNMQQTNQAEDGLIKDEISSQLDLIRQKINLSKMSQPKLRQQMSLEQGHVTINNNTHISSSANTIDLDPPIVSINLDSQATKDIFNNSMITSPKHSNPSEFMSDLRKAQKRKAMLDLNNAKQSCAHIDGAEDAVSQKLRIMYKTQIIVTGSMADRVTYALTPQEDRELKKMFLALNTNPDKTI